MAKSVLAHAESFDHLSVADLLPEIVDVARRNILPMDYDLDWNRVLFTVGPNCLYTVADNSIDLLVCNPPYIPGEFKSGPISAWMFTTCFWESRVRGSCIRMAPCCWWSVR